MRRAKFVPLVICAVSAAVLVIGVSASSAGRAAKVAIPLAPAYTNAQLDAYAGANWLSNGGDLKDDRYSTLNQVTPANVSGLKQAWHIHLGECVPVNGVTTSCPGQEENAVVADGIMYLATSKSQVFAIDATNGNDALALRADVRPGLQHRRGRPAAGRLDRAGPRLPRSA